MTGRGLALGLLAFALGCADLHRSGLRMHDAAQDAGNDMDRGDDAGGDHHELTGDRDAGNGMVARDAGEGTAQQDGGGASIDAGHVDIGSLCDAPLQYEVLRDAVLHPRCNTGGCHSPVTCGQICPPGPYVGRILFQPSSTRAELVDIPADVDSTLSLVVPTDPDASFLMQKLLGLVDAAHGSPMPPYVDSSGHWQEIPSDELAAVRCWIAGGAL